MDIFGLVKPKIPIKSWVKGAIVERNFQEMDHWGDSFYVFHTINAKIKF